MVVNGLAASASRNHFLFALLQPTFTHILRCFSFLASFGLIILNTETTPPPPPPLTIMNVGIIGAGIAGLAAGIALARAGHNVTIYEKSRFKNEIGAAILLTPNANRILRRWGFNFDSARPVDFKQFRFVHSDTLEIKGRENFEGVEEKYGDRMCAYQRIDLHGGLRDVAHQEVDGNILLGREVVGIDVENGEAEIKVLAPTDGKDAMVEKVKKDLWIMADGCHVCASYQSTNRTQQLT